MIDHMVTAIPQAILHPPAPQPQIAIAPKVTKNPEVKPKPTPKDTSKQLKKLEYGELEDFNKNSKDIKSAQVVQKNEKKLAEKEVYQSPNLYEVEGVHVKIYDFFDLPISTNDTDSIKKMQYISAWAFENSSFNDGLRKIRNVELKLGGSKFGESKLSAIYNYVKMRSLT